MIAVDRMMPSGAATRQTNFMWMTPAFFRNVIAADPLPPVASMGSMSSTSVDAMSAGNFW